MQAGATARLERWMDFLTKIVFNKGGFFCVVKSMNTRLKRMRRTFQCLQNMETNKEIVGFWGTLFRKKGPARRILNGRMRVCFCLVFLYPTQPKSAFISLESSHTHNPNNSAVYIIRT